jgi:hypothetical protein
MISKYSSYFLYSLTDLRQSSFRLHIAQTEGVGPHTAQILWPHHLKPQSEKSKTHKTHKKPQFPCCPVHRSPRCIRSILKRFGRSLSIQCSFGHDSRYRVGARYGPLLYSHTNGGGGGVGGHKERSHFCQIKSWPTVASPLKE